jgi:hypothetical protein
MFLFETPLYTKRAAWSITNESISEIEAPLCKRNKICLLNESNSGGIRANQNRSLGRLPHLKAIASEAIYN